MTARTTWTIDPAHTSVEFAVRHLMISTVKGRFGDVKGTVELDLENPAAARVDVTIGAASIDTRNADRDAHYELAVLNYATFLGDSPRSTVGAYIYDFAFSTEGPPTASMTSKPVIETSLSGVAKAWLSAHDLDRDGLTDLVLGDGEQVHIYQAVVKSPVGSDE